ncbi:serine/arginine-rich splicing factor SC35-like isoform X1 [Rhodamnia argentea]|uniref:Serine/arginine-rich splicing factor SC35-like isoform X1 n=1 Tax=Rhodamnia argentea TaxID=178133 RepID=A0ABM3HDV2_9MYRT|nr:serine/arginine-rich splicing factor SC35-like isoform X1 [Rhodamnia argentea]
MPTDSSLAHQAIVLRKESLALPLLPSLSLSLSLSLRAEARKRKTAMSHFGRSGPPDITDTYSLLVLNITFRTTADDLFPLFDKYGKVVDIFIPRDRRTGESRGFAFVRYKYADEAQKAVEKLDGRVVDGREITVQFAKYGPNAERIHKGRISENLPRSRIRSRSRSPRRRYRDDYRDRDRRRSRSRSKDRYDRDRHRGRDRDDRRRSRSRSASPDYYKSRGRGRYDDERRSRSRSMDRFCHDDLLRALHSLICRFTDFSLFLFPLIVLPLGAVHLLATVPALEGVLLHAGLSLLGVKALIDAVMMDDLRFEVFHPEVDDLILEVCHLGIQTLTNKCSGKR